MNTKTSRQGIATLTTSMEIRNKEELGRIVEKIMSIESVIDIERTRG